MATNWLEDEANSLQEKSGEGGVMWCWPSWFPRVTIARQHSGKAGRLSVNQECSCSTAWSIHCPWSCLSWTLVSDKRYKPTEALEEKQAHLMGSHKLLSHADVSIR